jgi:hypothetical protein
MFRLQAAIAFSILEVFFFRSTKLVLKVIFLLLQVRVETLFVAFH